MKTYSFMTKDSFRVDVKASSPGAAWKKLMAISYFDNRMTGSFLKYSKDGFAAVDSWQHLARVAV